MKWQAVLCLLGVVMLYLFGGALVFRALEKPNEMMLRNRLADAKESFLHENWCVRREDMQNLLKTEGLLASVGLLDIVVFQLGFEVFGIICRDGDVNASTLIPANLDKCLKTLPQTVVEAMGAGIKPTANGTNNTSIWDIGDAIFFAGTVLTTIGYGSPAPSTEGGRIFCTVFALFGIPLFGFLLAGVGDQLGSLIGRGIGHVERLFMRWNVSPNKIRVISALLFILVGLLLFGGVPIAVFMHIEHWSPLEAVYFVVVTLTTIGFGDYVAGSNPDYTYPDFYKPLVWLWVLVGMAYFAALLCMIGDWLRALSERTRSGMGGITSHAVQWSGLKERVSATDLLPPKLHKVAGALMPLDLLEKGGPTGTDGPQLAGGGGGESGSDSPEATGARMLGKALGRKSKGAEVKRPWVGAGVEEADKAAALVQKGSKPSAIRA